MPENLHQHVWIYTVVGIMVPVLLDKILISPSETERWVLLILAGIFWPLTLIFIVMLFLIATVIVSAKEVFRRVASSSAKVYPPLRKEKWDRDQRQRRG